MHDDGLYNVDCYCKDQDTVHVWPFLKKAERRA